MAQFLADGQILDSAVFANENGDFRAARPGGITAAWTIADSV
jgi:hypothetical protein